MNWRTTAVLFAILVVLGGYLLYERQREPAPAPTATPGPPAPERVELLPETTLEQVAGLTVTRHGDDRSASFARNADGSWTQTAPEATAVISVTLDSAVAGLASASSRRSFIPDNPLVDFGLAEPATTIILTGDRTVTFQVGSLTVAGDAYYVQLAGDERVHLVAPFTINNVLNLLDNPPVPTPAPPVTGTVPLTATAPVAP